MHVKIVLHVSADAQTVHSVDWNHLLASWTLKNMQLNHRFLARRYNPKLTETHLKHHIFPQQNLLPNHDEGTSRRADVSDVELGDVACSWRSAADLAGLGGIRGEVLDFTMASADEALTDNDVVARRMPSQRSSIGSNNVNVVEQLPLDSLEHQNVHVLDLAELVVRVGCLLVSRLRTLMANHLRI